MSKYWYDKEDTILGKFQRDLETKLTPLLTETM